MKKHLLKFDWMKALPICLILLAGFQMSCKDSVDEGDIYTFTGQTITQYIAADSNYSMFYTVLQKSKVSKTSKSYLRSLLSARGNYVAFVPTNEAMTAYLDSIYDKTDYTIDTMSEEIASTIAQNCIIDYVDEKAQMTTEYQVGAITKGTLNDRHIMVSFDTLQGGKFTVVLNGSSHIIVPDIEKSNGYVQVVDKVLSPSNATLPALLSEAENMRIFSHLLDVTGWDEQMIGYRDEVYEELPEDQRRNKVVWTSATYHAPEHRYYGYMAFPESDSVYNAQWGVPMPVVENKLVSNWDEIMSVINEKCREVYPDATDNDLTSTNNAINQFVSYHLINFKEPYNKLVRHMTEYGYNVNTPEILTLNIWEYMETMGPPRRLLKVTQTAADGVMHINRHSYYDNSFNGTYRETSCTIEGATISPNNGAYDNNALNGYYYPIDRMLLYDESVPNVVLNERIRYHMAAPMGELMSNDIRTEHETGTHYIIPKGYCETLDNSQCEVDFRTMAKAGTSSGWQGLQGNQFSFANKYIVTFRLFPVPYDGTYEVRYGVSNLASRGLCQGYFGTDPDNLKATGLPFYLRLAGSDPRIGSVLDATLFNDTLLCIENDLSMRNHMYMKAPKFYCRNDLTAAHATTLRSRAETLRLIVYRGPMKAGETYYFRFKTLLPQDATRQLFGAYFELVPKNVWDNPMRNEDIW